MNSTDQLISFLRTSGPSATEKAGVLQKDVNIFSKLQPFDLPSIAKKVAEIDLTNLRALLQRKDGAARDFDMAMRQARDLRKMLHDLDRDILIYQDTQKYVDERKRQLDQVFKNLLIRHVEYIENNVTVFTTEFLKKGDRQLGIFRIWIDWNYTSAGNAIRVVNFYKRYGTNDHPCIQNGSLCMGTAANTIHQHFTDKNLFVLLETIMAFLLSENISNGYVKQWGVWIKGCKKVPSDFSFESLRIRPTRTQPERQVVEHRRLRPEDATTFADMVNAISADRPLF